MVSLHEEARAEHNKTTNSYSEMVRVLERKIYDAKQKITSRGGKVDYSVRDKGRLRRIIAEENNQLKDVEETLKALTKNCEDRAREYDQRSGMRADEIAALQAALSNLRNADKVAIKDRAKGSDVTW